MMFKVNSSGLILTILYAICYCLTDFDNFKIQINNDLLTHKLENYMKKMKLKNSDLFNEGVNKKSELVYIDESFIKKLKLTDINERKEKLDFLIGFSE